MGNRQDVLLFDSLLKGNAFGAIICIEEEKDSEPLFAFRKFTDDGENTQSLEVERLSKGQLFVIDGQQRLQSLYIGLAGTYHGKRMYFDLFSDYAENEYDFNFSEKEDVLSKTNKERAESGICDTFWYPVSELYQRLADTNADDQVAEEIIARKKINDDKQKKHIEKNLAVFFRSVFTGDSIGLSKVSVNKSKDKTYNRQRIVELFRRLNDGGTKLSAYDLVASMFKGFDYRMERFLDSMIEQYKKIGLTQDNLLKSLLILRNLPSKEMADLTAEDADFAVNNRERIEKTFDVLYKFLQLAKLSDYYGVDKNRSFIPLYFIAYYIFYSNHSTDKLLELFNRFDTNDSDFRNIRRWIHLSLLNGVFRSRGSGWIPYKTGVRKIHHIMQQHQDKPFPADALFDMYQKHPLEFSPTITTDNLHTFDQEYLFYLLYDGEPTVRKEDIDHVHPKSKLEATGTDPFKVNYIANYQLLDSGTNRGAKSGKELGDWIENDVDETNRDSYLKRHCIPTDKRLWKSENFPEFLAERTELIVNKLNEFFK
ncbi:hypothetical protein FACS1894170_03150 [Planctomycetales bacterium]|nr:hypothetical protein FACS1894170_03150 [Planctomycetales bacterium]